MNTQLTADQMLAMIQRLQAENAALKAQPARKLTMKVTAKREDGTGTDGALSLYGLGRFPITLYKSQWQTLLKHAKDIEAFIVANADLLKDKPASA